MENIKLLSVRRDHGRAALTLSNGETLVMPRAMLKERPYRDVYKRQRLPRQVDSRADAEPFALRRLLRHALYDKHVAAFNLHALFQRQKSVEFLPDFHKRRMYGRPNCLYASVIERFRLPVRCTALQMLSLIHI